MSRGCHPRKLYLSVGRHFRTREHPLDIRIERVLLDVLINWTGHVRAAGIGRKQAESHLVLSVGGGYMVDLSPECSSLRQGYRWLNETAYSERVYLQKCRSQSRYNTHPKAALGSGNYKAEMTEIPALC